MTDTQSPLELSGVGGVIFADIIGNRHQVEAALNEGIPTVIINNYAEDLKVSSISVDNFLGAEMAVNYLINLGHRNIAHITGDLVTQAAVLRLEGYKSALKKKGIDIIDSYIVKTDYSRGEARQATEKLLSLPSSPSAIFVASDSMALEVMALSTERGKKIPRDLSIVGFDDNPSGLYGPVALTTVRQPLIKMAQEGVKCLHFLMTAKEKSIKKIKLKPELVIRDSCSSFNVSSV
jgi:LacI family transcriptional regulator